MRLRHKIYGGGDEIHLPGLPPIWVQAWLILPILALISPFLRKATLSGLIESVFIALGIMLSILAHELGHARMGQRFGLRPTLIRLHAGGGEVEFDEGAPTRREYRLVILAGPAVNLLIFILCLSSCELVKTFLASPPPPDSESFLFIRELSAESRQFLLSMRPDPAPLVVLRWLGWFNLALAFLNLLPAYPLDGGHLFHDYLEARLGRRRAQLWTGLIGLVLAILVKGLMIAALTFGMLIWSPPYLTPNWRAFRQALNKRASLSHPDRP
ncbi:site-2 protease family protein [Labrys okinawensis]|nr:site-2 protease family protein [Labrys okinawensis]